MSRDVNVRLEGPLESGGKEQLSLCIDGAPLRMAFRVGSLNRQLVMALPDAVHDLLDVAATVYAADCSTPRGGLTDAGFGKDWRRHFHLDVPVRCPEVWNRNDIGRALSETLGFLSDDYWHFVFRPSSDRGPTQGILDFGPESGFRPSSVVMFSGGLDSYAGAVEELVEREERIVLVSHGSATKLAKVQRDLVTEIRNRVGVERVQHVTLKSQLANQGRKEGTQRSRSFLFASLGMAVAEMFDLNRVSFFENGVVSLNLPPVAQVVGARATRTTHPKALRGFSRLFSALLGGQREVRNPFMFRTKGEVVETIKRLGFRDQIRHTHSCADVHNRSRMHSHCGRCSQCIDRRFAILAQGLEADDPAEAYAVDLMNDSRPKASDREMVLSYVRNALFFSLADQGGFLTKFPEIARALAETGEPAARGCNRLHDLFRRHGQSVTRVLRDSLAKGSVDVQAPDSLLALYRADELGGLESDWPTQSSPTLPPTDLILDREKQTATLSGFGPIGGATFRLLNRLADAHLSALGAGKEPEDFPCVASRFLMGDLKYGDEDSVRRAVKNARKKLHDILERAGRPELEVIENIATHGYRLTPDSLRVRVVHKTKKLERGSVVSPPQ